MHSTQTRRNGDHLTDTRNKPADEGGHIAFLAEILLGFLYLRTREQAEMAEFAVGELIDDDTSKPNGEAMINDGSYHGTERAEEHDEQDIHRVGAGDAKYTFRLTGYEGGRGDHYFAGEGNKRTLHRHQRSNRRIVHMRRIPRDQFVNECHLDE